MHSCHKYGLKNIINIIQREVSGISPKIIDLSEETEAIMLSVG